MVGRYDYSELREKAIHGTQADVDALGEWFELYGNRYWNGECYDADDGYRLFKKLECHYDEDGELDFCETAGYEFR